MFGIFRRKRDPLIDDAIGMMNECAETFVGLMRTIERLESENERLRNLREVSIKNPVMSCKDQEKLIEAIKGPLSNWMASEFRAAMDYETGDGGEAA